MATTYRTCPVSGLQFEDQAEKLMRWNAVAGVLALLAGGITALLVILTRWPAIKLLPADQFYLILTAHGIDMLILWIIFFEMAVLYFASSTLLTGTGQPRFHGALILRLGNNPGQGARRPGQEGAGAGDVVAIGGAAFANVLLQQGDAGDLEQQKGHEQGRNQGPGV